MSKSSTDKPGAENDFTRTDTDERYRILASEDRRFIIDVLADTTSVSLDTLAEEIQAKKRDSRPKDRIKVSLVHQHLPLMENAGAVEYDQEREQITPCEPVSEELRHLL